MYFSDIHIHLLYGADDGAQSYEEMIAMVDMAYEQGVRFLCATPHFDPSVFGDNRDKAKQAFEQLEEYCNAKYPDLELCLGNELFYVKDSGLWVMKGLCRTMGNTKCVLVEFSPDVSETQMDEAFYRLLNRGYIPILAHAERYHRVRLKKLQLFSRMGVLIQANSDMLFVGRFAARRLTRMLKCRLVDFISTDAHNLSGRCPNMKRAFELLSKEYGSDYAEAICYGNAVAKFSKIKTEDRK